MLSITKITSFTPMLQFNRPFTPHQILLLRKQTFKLLFLLREANQYGKISNIHVGNGIFLHLVLASVTLRGAAA